MIITNKTLEAKPPKNMKFFKDTTCLVNLVKTEQNLGVVCYLYDDLNTWCPFNISSIKKYKFRAKTYNDLIINLPKISSENISDIRGKFYNTFDTPVEINHQPIATVFNVNNEDKNVVFERKTYYIITDVQELERSFNSNILPCEIIDFNNINQLYKDKPVDESLRFVIDNVLNKL